MWFKRMIIEKESPEEWGYDKIKYNLSESSIPDRKFDELDIDFSNLTLFYGDHSGDPRFRELIAHEHYGLKTDQVLLTAGACMALFIVNSTILKPGDRILVLKPNYASNIEVPRSLGINVDLLNLKFENNFELDLDELEGLIAPQTKLISITYPHNPSGVLISEEQLEKIVNIAEDNNCYLLVDETYRELTFGQKLPTAASLSTSTISVESLSKSYGLPGIRMGWLATQNKDLKEAFLATKEQIVICNSVIDEEIAYSVYKQKDKFMNSTKESNKNKFDIVTEWMNKQTDIEWVQPKGGVVCFPRVKKEINIDLNKFYQILIDKYGTFVGIGRWFEMDDRFFRVGYGWPSEDELKGGLECITKAIEEAKL